LQRQPLSADSQAFVRTILESAQATIRALNDAVDLSRVEAGEQTFKMSSVRLRELMDDVQAGWQARASRDGVTLLVAYDGEPELSVELDPDRMRQVLDLLVEGALTGASHGAVEVSLQARRGPDGIRLTGHVRDGGGGLLGRGLTDGPDVGEGPSLGVALCQKLIDRMGGVIRAENNIGAGSTVTFTLDVQETALERTPSLGEAALGYRGAAHVLVVDDNATNRMVAEALCEMFDCTSECAEDGVEAVEAARSGRFDLILMDIRMPQMDGVEATRAIRALPGRAGAVPIIALTANADAEDTKRYMGCGMHSVVEKPIKPERLLQAINAALPPAGEAVAA
jgi:CheY-like chemotaxis protein